MVNGRMELLMAKGNFIMMTELILKDILKMEWPTVKMELLYIQTELFIEGKSKIKNQMGKEF